MQGKTKIVHGIIRHEIGIIKTVRMIKILRIKEILLRLVQYCYIIFAAASFPVNVSYFSLSVLFTDFHNRLQYSVLLCFPVIKCPLFDMITYTHVWKYTCYSEPPKTVQTNNNSNFNKLNFTILSSISLFLLFYLLFFKLVHIVWTNQKNILKRNCLSRYID